MLPMREMPPRKYKTIDGESKVEVFIFTGAKPEELPLWLDNIMDAALCCNWNQSTILKVMVETTYGRARDVVRQEAQQQMQQGISDPDALRVLLMKRFIPYSMYHVHHDRLKNMRKNPNENYVEFGERFSYQVRLVNMCKEAGNTPLLDITHLIELAKQTISGRMYLEMAKNTYFDMYEFFQAADTLDAIHQNYDKKFRKPIVQRPQMMPQFNGKKSQYQGKTKAKHCDNHPDSTSHDTTECRANKAKPSEAPTKPPFKKPYKGTRQTNVAFKQPVEEKSTHDNNSYEVNMIFGNDNKRRRIQDKEDKDPDFQIVIRNDQQVNPTIPPRIIPIVPELIQVTAEINGIAIRALIDPGANVTLCNAAVARKLQLDWNGLAIANIKFGQGNPVKAKGPISIIAKFPEFSRSKGAKLTTFVTDNITHDLILGLDALRILQCKLDLEKNILTLFNTDLQLGPASKNTQPVITNAFKQEPIVEYIPEPDVFFICMTAQRAEQESSIKPLLDKYPNILGSDNHIGRCEIVKHHIRLSPEAPIFHSHPYRVPMIHMPELKKQVQQLLDNKIIQPSTSPYASPAFLIPKKNQQLRLVIDYRKLNQYTNVPRFPMPNIKELLQSLQGAKVFSQIDLNSGYYQIEMAINDVEKTAFVVPFGQYEFLRMPFGLSGAPMTFQMLMTRLLSHLPFVKVYLDDILIHSKDMVEHKQHVREVFEILVKANLTINLEKSKFFQKEVEYLGYTISEGIVTPTERNLSKISDIPTPHNRKTTKRLIGALNFFRDMIPNLSGRISAISDLTSEKTTFKWKPEFTQIINEIIEDLKLKAYQIQPDHEKPFEIFCDASIRGVGAILVQDKKLIACFSKKLNLPQQKYTTTEQETMAIVLALKNWRPILFGQKVTIYTDHSNLKFLNTSNTPRCQRWKLLIDEFQPKIQHISGQDNFWADILSREQILQDPTPIIHKEINNIESLYPISTNHIKEEQKLDEESNKIRKAILEQGTYPQYPDLILQDEVIINKSTLAMFVPKPLRISIMHWMHDSLRHPGITAMYTTISFILYWPNIKDDIIRFVNQCQTCAQVKSTKQYGKLQQRVAEKLPWNTIAIDIIGPIKFENEILTDENQYILTIVDTCSRWVELIPLKDITALTVCQAFDTQWLCRYPKPNIVISDQGTQFTSKEFQELLESYGIQHRSTTTYNPTGNSICERTNGSVITKLRTSNNPLWSEELQAIAWSLRTKQHSTLKYSPSQLVFGTLMMDSNKRFPVDQVIENAHKNTQRSTTKDLDRVNNKRIDHSFQPNDQVFVKNIDPKKIDPRYRGPFKIIKTYPKQNACKIDFGSYIENISIRKLKPFP